MNRELAEPMIAEKLAADSPAFDVMARDTKDASSERRRFLKSEDMELVKLAAKLTREHSKHDAKTYWVDFLGSALLGYGAMLGAILTANIGMMLAFGLVSVLALYRAGSFIHEISHMKKNSVPGFKWGWNALIGVPLMMPSFMYEGVHNLHHNKTRYGTVKDPEYLPLALMKPWTVPLFVVVAALAPIALLVRYGVLTPLSFLVPPLRNVVVERYSGLVINPEFRRKMPDGEARRDWLLLEGAASIWVITLITLTALSIIPLGYFLTYLGILSVTVVINQVRTLVAHLWENEGEAMSVTAQYLDSVNVPPPALLPELWAPVGLRYHALHHLLPSIPYHELGKAHRELVKILPQHSPYWAANYDGLPGLVKRLVKSTFAKRA